MANIATDLVERLRSTHRLMKLHSAAQSGSNRSETRLVEAPRRPQVMPHKPAPDHRLRSSHID